MEEKSKIIVGLFNLEQHLDVYYKTIEDHLECPSWVRKKYMELLKNDVADFLEMNPDATMDDVCRFFGDPFDQNNELLRKVERTYFEKLRRRLIICYGLIGVLIFALILIAVILTQCLSNSTQYIRVTNFHDVNKV